MKLIMLLVGVAIIAFFTRNRPKVKGVALKSGVSRVAGLFSRLMPNKKLSTSATTPPTTSTPPAKKQWFGGFVAVPVRTVIVLALVGVVWALGTFTPVGDWWISARESGVFRFETGRFVWVSTHFREDELGVPKYQIESGGECETWERYLGFAASLPKGRIEYTVVGKRSVWLAIALIALLWVVWKGAGVWKRFPLNLLVGLLRVGVILLSGWYVRNVFLIHAPTDSSEFVVTLWHMLLVCVGMFLLFRIVQVSTDPKGWRVYSRHLVAGFWWFCAQSTIALFLLGWLMKIVVA